MKTAVSLSALACVACTAVFGQSQLTPNLQFNTPYVNAPGWNGMLNANFNKLDLILSGNQGVPSSLFSTLVSPATPASGVRLYLNSDGLLHVRDINGNDYALTAGAYLNSATPVVGTQCTVGTSPALSFHGTPYTCQGSLGPNAGTYQNSPAGPAAGTGDWTGLSNSNIVHSIQGIAVTPPASGLLVGRTDAQVITNKDLTSGNTFPSIASQLGYTAQNAAVANTNNDALGAANAVQSASAQKSANGSDFANVATVRTNLGFSGPYFALPTVSGDGTLNAGTGALAVSNLSSASVYLNNNTAMGVNQAGATAGAKIAAAIAGLPSTGGSVDASGITGAQSWATNIFSGVTKPVTLTLGQGVTTINAASTIPGAATLQFSSGAIIHCGAVVTINGAINAPPSQQIFDTSCAGGNLILKTPTQVSTGWFGPDITGATNSTANLQTAIDSITGTGKTLYWQSGNYLATTLNVPNGATWQGGATNEDGASVATSITGVSGSDLIVTSVSPLADQVTIRDMAFTLSAGSSSTFHVTAMVGLRMENVAIQGPVGGYGLLVDTFMERSTFINVTFSSNHGPAGFGVTNNGNTSTNYLDKIVFINCRWVGGNVGVFHDTSRTSNAVTFMNPVFNAQRNYGMLLKGGIAFWYILNAGFEQVGDPSTGAPASAITTGTTSGTSATSIVVASATNLAATDVLTIKGGGTNGDDVSICIASSYVSGTTIPLDATSCTAPPDSTLSPNIPLQVTATEVTHNTGMLIAMGPPSQNSGNSNRMTIESVSLGNTANANLVYSVDLHNCSGCNMINVNGATRPIYDPFALATVINANGFRSAASLAASNFNLESFRAINSDTVYPSVFPGNPGSGVIIPLIGTGTNGLSGTYGNFSVMTKGPSRRSYFSVNGDTGTVQVGPFGESPALPNLVVGSVTIPASSWSNSISLANGTAGAAITGVGTMLASEGHLELQTNLTGDQIGGAVSNLASGGTVRFQLRTAADVGTLRNRGFQLASFPTFSAILDYEARPIDIYTGAAAGSSSVRARFCTNGDVNIGNTLCSSLFQIGSTGQAKFDSSGNFTAPSISGTGSAPAITSCGTSPTLTTGSTNLSGSVLEGSGATGCTITWAAAFAATPISSNVTATTGLTSYSASTSAIVVVNSTPGTVSWFQTGK